MRKDQMVQPMKPIKKQQKKVFSYCFLLPFLAVLLANLLSVSTQWPSVMKTLIPFQGSVHHASWLFLFFVKSPNLICRGWVLVDKQGRDQYSFISFFFQIIPPPTTTTTLLLYFFLLIGSSDKLLIFLALFICLIFLVVRLLIKMLTSFLMYVVSFCFYFLLFFLILWQISPTYLPCLFVFCGQGNYFCFLYSFFLDVAIEEDSQQYFRDIHIHNGCSFWLTFKIQLLKILHYMTKYSCFYHIIWRIFEDTSHILKN